jgi:hypothetical protein
MESYWICKVCTYSNDLKTDKCIKCFSHKNNEESFKDSDEMVDENNNINKSFKIGKTSNIKIKFNKKASHIAPCEPAESNSAINYPYNESNNFIDFEFPANKDSVFNSNKPFKFSELFLMQLNGFNSIIKWLRPHEIKVKQEDRDYALTLFADPNPDDVVQGGVGSCWFISSIASLAERPELLMNTTWPKIYNPSGFHQVRLCIRGRWIVVNIDDYLPCNIFKKLVFAYSKKRQFFVPLIEKALAKFHGSYESIASGATVEGLQTLTGEPCEVLYLENARINLKDPSYPFTTNTENSNPYVLWQKVLLARRMGFLMITLCYNKKLNIIDFTKVGLFNRHIYTILDAREFEYNNEMIRLLKLRNPWGRSKFF